MNSQLNTACFTQFAVLLVLVSQFQTISSDWFANINADSSFFTLSFCLYRVCIKPSHSQTITTCNSKQSRPTKVLNSHIAGLYTQGPRMILLMVIMCNPRNRMWCFFQLILLSFSLTVITLLHEKFCNLIGLEPWYFSLIWNTYMRKLGTVCR